jgi:hypothetical protein
VYKRQCFVKGPGLLKEGLLEEGLLKERPPVINAANRVILLASVPEAEEDPRVAAAPVTATAVASPGISPGSVHLAPQPVTHPPATTAENPATSRETVQPKGTNQAAANATDVANPDIWPGNVRMIMMPLAVSHRQHVTNAGDLAISPENVHRWLVPVAVVTRHPHVTNAEDLAISPENVHRWLVPVAVVTRHPHVTNAEDLAISPENVHRWLVPVAEEETASATTVASPATLPENVPAALGVPQPSPEAVENAITVEGGATSLENARRLAGEVRDREPKAAAAINVGSRAISPVSVRLRHDQASLCSRGIAHCRDTRLC